MKKFTLTTLTLCLASSSIVFANEEAAMKPSLSELSEKVKTATEALKNENDGTLITSGLSSEELKKEKQRLDSEAENKKAEKTKVDGEIEKNKKHQKGAEDLIKNNPDFNLILGSGSFSGKPKDIVKKLKDQIQADTKKTEDLATEIKQLEKESKITDKLSVLAEAKEKLVEAISEVLTETVSATGLQNDILTSLKKLQSNEEVNNIFNAGSDEIINFLNQNEKSLYALGQTYQNLSTNFNFNTNSVAAARLNSLSALNTVLSASNSPMNALQGLTANKKNASVWVSYALNESKLTDATFRTKNINLGVDKQFDSILVGGFLSYMDKRGGGAGTKGNLYGYALSIYAQKYHNNHAITGMVSAGKTKNHIQRDVVGYSSFEHQADTQGRYFSSKGEYSYIFDLAASNLQLNPVLGLNYQYATQDAFTESGLLPLAVGALKTQQLTTNLGVELKKFSDKAYFYAKPSVLIDVFNKTNAVSIQYLGQEHKFSLPANSKRKTYFALELGTKIMLRPNVVAEFNLDGKIRKGEKHSNVNAKLTYSF